MKYKVTLIEGASYSVGPLFFNKGDTIILSEKQLKLVNSSKFRIEKLDEPQPDQDTKKKSTK